jgi:hypothetical protein
MGVVGMETSGGEEYEEEIENRKGKRKERRGVKGAGKEQKS